MGLDLPKKTLQEIVILPALRPEVRTFHHGSISTELGVQMCGIEGHTFTVQPSFYTCTQLTMYAYTLVQVIMHTRQLPAKLCI